MKLLTLTVTNVENVNAEYDFTAGNIRSPEQAVHFLEYALFGNDVIFAGKIILTAEYAGETYEIIRDFSAGTVVYRDGYRLGAEKSERILQKLAGLKQSQWEENVKNVDFAEFCADPTAYLKKYLSELGFDSEELEKRWDFYYKDHSLYVSKVEAYDELVDDSYVEISADKKQKLDALHEKLEAIAVVKQSAEEKGFLLSLKQSLTERKAELEERAEEIEAKRALLEKDDRLREKSETLAALSEAEGDVDALKQELDAVNEEIENIKKEIESLREELAAKAEEADAHADRATGLRDSFGDLLDANLEDRELTDAVTAKAAGVVATTEGEEVGSVAELRSAHKDYRKRRAYREGVAFENSFDSSELRIADLTEKIEENRALAEKIKEEIGASGEVAATTDTETISEADRLSVSEGRVIAKKLENDIAAETDRIRELLKKRKTQAEDVNALKKAMVAQKEYLRRCEKRKTLLDGKLLESRSRIAFGKNKNELEIGETCPVCSSRIVDKEAVSADISKVVDGYNQLQTEWEENEKLLAEAREKLLDIEVRLAQLKERNNSIVSTINALTASVNDKKKRLTDILKNNGVNSVPDLERKYRALPPVGSEEAVRAHVEFLNVRLAEIAAAIEKDEATIASEQERLDAMRQDYDENIKPELNGRPASDGLDEMVESDIREDEIIANLNEAGDPDIYVNLTAEIFADIMAEIKKSDDLRKEAETACADIRERLENDEIALTDRTAYADKLNEKIEEISSEVNNALDDIGTEETEEETLLSDEERARIKSETEKFDSDMQAIEIQIAALEGYGEVEFDSDEYRNLTIEAEKAEKAYVKASTRLAVSEAAKDLAYKNTFVCEELTIKMDNLKKITDGETFDVIIPVLNDVLASIGEELEARPNGNEIAFYGHNGKAVSLEEIDGDVISLLSNCAVNYVMNLVTGEETTRFALLENGGENVISTAQKYNVTVL